MAATLIHDGLFDLGDDGSVRLIGGFSPTSGRHHFPLSPVCPYTGAEDVEEVRLSDQGTLWAWTAVNVAPPGFAGDVPYGLGVVELTEGLRVVGRLTEADPSALSEGQAMRVVGVTVAGPDGAEAVVWGFAPEGPDG